MIYDEPRKFGIVQQSAASLMPNVSPLTYQPSVTATGSKANLGEVYETLT